MISEKTTDGTVLTGWTGNEIMRAITIGLETIRSEKVAAGEAVPAIPDYPTGGEVGDFVQIRNPSGTSLVSSTSPEDYVYSVEWVNVTG